jgi:ribosomal protein S6
MADETTLMENDVEAAVSRIYEVGYHIVPSIKEEDLEKIVSAVRAEIEKAGGSFIAEGAPALTRLMYPMTVKEGGKAVEYDRGYFGWIKFDATVAGAKALEEAMKANHSIMRCIVFKTVREDTRAKIRPTLREVKRTDTIKSAPRRTEESAAPVSEEDLEKALLDITKE